MAAEVVGRDREMGLLVAALSAGRDVLLEGPPGTGKSKLLRTITGNWGVPFVIVEGHAELTAARLIGYHEPASVLREGYTTENFVPGPLVQALRDGAFLYFEEFNRAPTDTLNVLLAAMAEREIVVPRVGTIKAEPTFRVLASMNPFDAVGTGRVSESVYDRWCRMVIGYQSEAEECEIVARRTGVSDPALVEPAVAICRATRVHPELRRGSSVRGAIDIVAVAAELAATDDRREVRDLILDAAKLALSGRIFLDEASERTTEDVITELWEAHYFSQPG